MIENPYLFACEWYKPEQVFSCLNHNLNRPDSDRYAKIPADVTSMEFATWLTEEYRLAMSKGIELGKRDAVAEFAERIEKRLLPDVVPLRRPNRLRVLTDDELARLSEKHPFPKEWYDEPHPDAPVIQDEPLVPASTYTIGADMGTGKDFTATAKIQLCHCGKPCCRTPSGSLSKYCVDCRPSPLFSGM